MRVLLQHSVSLQEPRSLVTSTKTMRKCQVRLGEDREEWGMVWQQLWEQTK